MSARGEGGRAMSLALPLEQIIKPSSARISSVRSSYTANTTSSRLSVSRVEGKTEEEVGRQT